MFLSFSFQLLFLFFLNNEIFFIVCHVHNYSIKKIIPCMKCKYSLASTSCKCITYTCSIMLSTGSMLCRGGLLSLTGRKQMNSECLLLLFGDFGGIDLHGSVQRLKLYDWMLLFFFIIWKFTFLLSNSYVPVTLLLRRLGSSYVSSFTLTLLLGQCNKNLHIRQPTEPRPTDE